MLGIHREAAIFISACLTGNVLYLSYRVLDVFRRLVKHSGAWVSVEDLLYWICAGFYLFKEIYRTCNGTIRWYFVIGVTIGVILTAIVFLKFLKFLKK